MQNVFLYLYYATLCSAAFIGVYKHKHIDKAMLMIVYLLILTSVSEIISFILIKNEKYVARYSLFHCFNILQLLLICMFFIYKAKPYHLKRLVILTVITCPSIGLLNIILFQPFNVINSNMLMFECLIITSLSLHLIYTTVKKDIETNLFKDTHVRIALILLLSWSSTFFFWAFIELLYDESWPYSIVIMHSHMILNILAYFGIGWVLYFYPKKQLAHGNS